MRAARDAAGAKPDAQQQMVKNVMRGAAVVIVPATAWFESGVFIYWLTAAGPAVHSLPFSFGDAIVASLAEATAPRPSEGSEHGAQPALAAACAALGSSAAGQPAH
ncbi:hypothetical protein EMIHUDRAFT_257318 [Emiliania huxleyi CCMP1516]|uniref:Exostosin GT47 domain-containing protein n=2 Tax=Emiliania huxleyi TaxID=2903 RepID=A0A0D3IKE8_EMIH1|nr:hypothetical protein EMIHUDRAFT_257318 [Emiliania huxleyi CCMP1516]EOD11733.1 hypothetical protein EMIHUDRAFT_257318 [Emiliania huxleyi CCMP1516]|eukprot:XP_005764162.1 hypothetical protein EMIHUDRAFT_257318 [Emiliania huxleyi CCMP1516]